MNMGAALYEALRRKAPPRVGHQFSREYWRGYDMPKAPLPAWIDPNSAKFSAWRAGRDDRRDAQRKEDEAARDKQRAAHDAACAERQRQQQQPAQ